MCDRYARAVLVGHDEEMIHENIKLIATIDKDNGKTNEYMVGR